MEVIPEKVFMICVGENIRTKSCLKTFRASLGKFGQKSFVPPKFACSYTCAFNSFTAPCPTAVLVFGIPANYGKMFVVVRYLVHEAGVKVKLKELKSRQVKLLQY